MTVQRVQLADMIPMGYLPLVDRVHYTTNDGCCSRCGTNCGPETDIVPLFSGDSPWREGDRFLRCAS